ncbi:unnamed protein product [Peronospora belbahrii]|uniref:Uncharacterized protein n=1 Tax=Peronospora belbahrii TaxID=622444 RepID=A0AAU9KUH6_9STRA|nr:unnamed protein product [Peronospora belbahrii]
MDDTCKHDKQMIAAANMYDGNLMEPRTICCRLAEYGWLWSGAAPLVESERTTVLPHRVKKHSLETHRAHQQKTVPQRDFTTTSQPGLYVG